MAQKQLQPHYQRRSLMFALLVGLLSACANASDDRLGMTLLFINRGTYGIGVHRFAPDSSEGPVPGSLGVGGGAHMSFMPADNKHGIPKFVDIEWMVATPAYNQAWVVLSSRSDKYSKQWMNDVDEVNASAPRYKRRIDLTPILTPELLAQVRTNRKNTLLKLKVVFTDDDVTVTASAEVWR